MSGVRRWLAGAADAVMEAAVAPSFSRVGYDVRSKLEGWDPVTTDMRGKVVVITGASSGLGRAAALRLAALGAQLILVGRDRKRLDAVRSECLVYAQADDDVAVVVADLTRFADARDLVDQVNAISGGVVDVLIHNAGALVHQYGETEDGHEQTYAAQVLSQHIITSGLLPLLEKASDPRVLVVSSGGMYSQKLQPEAMEMSRDSYDGVRAYALAKRAQVALNSQWARRFPEVFFAAMHPGWADTPGVASSLPTFKKITGPFLRTPEQGADTIVWLAAAPLAPSLSGRFWLDRAPRAEAKLPGTAGSVEDAADLWRKVCEQTGVQPDA